MIELDAVAINKAEDNEQAKAERLLDDGVLKNLSELMAIPGGRRFLWALLERTHLYSATVTADRTGRVDLAGMAINEGERQLGLWLVDQLTEASPRLWLQMQREQIEETHPGMEAGKGD